MLDANSLSAFLIVTGLVLALVFLLPFFDRRISASLGLNLEGGISSNPNADRLLRLRGILMDTVFCIYLAAVAYIVFFSRTATKEYQVHAALFEDLKNSVRIDFGFLKVIATVFTDGFREALSHVRIERVEDIAQVYMNVLLFVPMGYLLPYISPFFRAKAHYRPALACFLCSLLIENAQLVFRRGFYDVDDLVSNTLGGVIGQFLFISVAYVVTHPDWRKEWKAYRRWKRNAKKRTLYPFARRMHLSRTVLRASKEEDIWDFYVMKLGFRLKKQLVPLDSPETGMLLEMGSTQVEVRCANRPIGDAGGELTISCRNLGPIIRRLRANGIETGGIEQDPYTDLRCVRFSGPDRVRITVIEK